MEFNHKASFVREFSFLSKLPGFNHVCKIRVERGSPGLLEETGQETQYTMGGSGPFDSYTKFFAVIGGNVVGLKTAGVYTRSDSPFESDRYAVDETWQAERNGVQLCKLGLRPDFIVRCVQDGSGNSGDVLTIYKMDRFDYGRYFENERSRELRKEEQEEKHRDRQQALSEAHDRDMDNEWSDYWDNE
ncbi:MAG: hypothetical protein AAB726_03385 [Patescibacteria group bacterium]